MFQYDPQGSLVQRQTGGNTSYPALDTAMYDAYGSKLGDTDAFRGGAEPVRDAVGFQGQFGAYTDNQPGLLCLTHGRVHPRVGRHSAAGHLKQGKSLRDTRPAKPP